LGRMYRRVLESLELELVIHLLLYSFYYANFNSFGNVVIMAI